MQKTLTAALATSLIAIGSAACADQTDETMEQDAMDQGAMEQETMQQDTMQQETMQQDTMMDDTMADNGEAYGADTDMSSDMGAPMEAQAVLMDPDGNEVGTVSLTQTPNGVLLSAGLMNLPEGEHGFHIHETGTCSPDFGAAGGHYAPRGNDHGALEEGGMHAGDMPNIFVAEDGTAVTERLNANISLRDGETGTLFDDDGSAIMIHSGPDDYESQPSGAAGDRIACGVVERL